MWGGMLGVSKFNKLKKRSYYLTETQFHSNFIDQLVVDPIRYGYSIPLHVWYIYLHDWVILDKGKCWDSYSSTMVRIWDCIQSRSIYLSIYINIYKYPSKSSIYRWIFHYKPTYYLCQSMGSTQPLFFEWPGASPRRSSRPARCRQGRASRWSPNWFYHWNMTRTS